MWMLLELQYTPESYHFKWNRFDYSPVFKKGFRAHLYTRLAYSRDQWKSSLRTEIKWESFFHYYFFECTLKDTLMAKMVIFCHQHLKWYQDPWFVPETTSIPTLHIVVPPVFEHQPSRAVKQLLAACEVNYFREIEVEGNNVFIERKILWFLLRDSIQGKSSWFFLHKPTRYCEFESNRPKQMI